MEGVMKELGIPIPEYCAEFYNAITEELVQEPDKKRKHENESSDDELLREMNNRKIRLPKDENCRLKKDESDFIDDVTNIDIKTTSHAESVKIETDDKNDVGNSVIEDLSNEHSHDEKKPVKTED